MKKTVSHLGETATLSTSTLTCAWVNANQLPREIKRLKIFKYTEMGIREYRYWELCQVAYPHPEAPELARCTVDLWREVTLDSHTGSLVRYLCDAMSDLGKITTLVDSRVADEEA